jgi:hypothetical protein
MERRMLLGIKMHAEEKIGVFSQNKDLLCFFWYRDFMVFNLFSCIHWAWIYSACSCTSYFQCILVVSGSVTKSNSFL